MNKHDWYWTFDPTSATRKQFIVLHRPYVGFESQCVVYDKRSVRVTLRIVKGGPSVYATDQAWRDAVEMFSAGAAMFSWPPIRAAKNGLRKLRAALPRRKDKSRWCSWCSRWCDHATGSCPDLKGHFVKENKA